MGLRVESMWLTHRESVTITDPGTGEAITRDFSIGMTIKSDGEKKSDEMYQILRRSLNVIVEEEKETWFDNHHMKSEVKELKEKIANGDTDGKAESGTG